MRQPRAMLALDSPSIAMGEAVAVGLRSRGVATKVKLFSEGVPMHPLTADLVIVGLGLVSGEVVGARAARSWLASIAAEVPGQLAAAFNVRTGWDLASGQLTAGAVGRVMSASGFRLADQPMTFRTFGDVVDGSEREFARAEDWGRSLADTLQLFMISAVPPRVSGEGH